jgi:hypothetical protein
MQVYVTRQAEIARRFERQEDDRRMGELERRTLDQAYQVVHSEYFRIRALADRWSESDLAALSAHGVLEPDEVLPKSWRHIVDSMSALSPEAGVLGAVALSFSCQVRGQVASLNALVDGYRRQHPERSSVEIHQLVVSNRKVELRLRSEKLVAATKELATILWDASLHSESAVRGRALGFRGDLKSEFARAMVAEMGERGKPDELAHNDGSKPWLTEG